MISKAHSVARKRIHVAVLAGLLAVVPLFSGVAASTDIDIAALANAQAQEVWHTTLNALAPPAEGCWSASYPSTIWKKVPCGAPPPYRSTPPSPSVGGSQTTTRSLSSKTAGNGYNYAAKTKLLTRSAKGSFPTVLGVESVSTINVDTHEVSDDEYSLQINTNFSNPYNALDNTSPSCEHKGYAKCATWQQFVYSAAGWWGSGLYIQNWLFIGKDDQCPSNEGWWSHVENNKKTGAFVYNGCVKNSEQIWIPGIPVSDLAKVAIYGAAEKNGLDTVRLYYGDEIYVVTQTDSTLDIASTWRQSEFNIEGHDSKEPLVEFNPGSYLTVQLEVYDGSGKAPECFGPEHGGTTFEQNNLTLGRECEVTGDTDPGSAKWIRFGESNVANYPDFHRSPKGHQHYFPWAEPSFHIYL